MAFGQDMPLSIGGSAGYVFESQYGKASNTFQTQEVTGTSSSFSVGAFFDLAYAELGLGIESQIGKTAFKIKSTYASNPPPNTDTSQDTDFQDLNLLIKALGKYPFHFDKITVFPLAGFEYSLNVSEKDKDKLSDDQKSDLNDLFLDLGAGIDYPLTEQLYIRGEGIFGLNLTAKPTAALSGGASWDSNFGYRINAILSIGYKL